MEIRVFGNPAPQGSKTAVVRGGKAIMFESSKKLPEWRDTVMFTCKMVRATGSPTVPGTNQGRIYFKAGTTGLALYVMGPTGTEIKVVDNIT